MMNIEEIYQIYQKHSVISTDSRNCIPNSIFIALKGERFDGNLFIEKALQMGCSYAITDNPIYSKNKQIIFVENSLDTLQKLASYHRKKMKAKIIAITGTNGKTTTKELVSSVLSSQFHTLFTKGNLNNHIGVPLTLLNIQENHEFAIIEMGANHPGEIKKLAEIADPDYGLITNIGKAHLEGFGSFENIIKTKGELFDYIRLKSGKIFINHENPYLKNISKDIEKIYYGKDSLSLIWGDTVSRSSFFSFDWFYKNESFQVITHLIGNYNLENALAAVCIGKYFNISNDNICNSISNYIPSNNRSQFKETKKNHLIIDTYNANPTSMYSALENFHHMDLKPKVIILGDMKELGEYSISEHQSIIDYLKKNPFDHVMLCGNIFSSIQNHTYITFKNTEDLLEYLKNQSIKNSYILIKGSRENQLEKTIEFL